MYEVAGRRIQVKASTPDVNTLPNKGLVASTNKDDISVIVHISITYPRL